MTRIFRVAGVARDRDGVAALISEGLRSGECKRWPEGIAVRVEERAFGQSCVAPLGTAEACYWTPVEALKR